MNYKSRPYGAGDDGADPSYEHTFRAADAGRYGSEGLNAILSSSRQRGFNGDDTGDVFLKIAREEPTGRTLDENLMDDNPSTTTTVSTLFYNVIPVPRYKIALRGPPSNGK